MFAGLILDLDNTLYDEVSYFLSIFKIASGTHKFDLKKIENILSYGFIQKSADVFGDVLKAINRYNISLQEDLFNLYKTSVVRVALYEEAEEILQFAKDRNLKIGIITNGVVEAQKNKIKCLDIKKFSDSIIYAREFGKQFEKPHEKPFVECLKQLRLNKEEVLCVGDNVYTDILGAKNIGITSIYFNCNNSNTPDIEADYEIFNLIELKIFLTN